MFFKRMAFQILFLLIIIIIIIEVVRGTDSISHEKIIYVILWHSFLNNFQAWMMSKQRMTGPFTPKWCSSANQKTTVKESWGLPVLLLKVQVTSPPFLRMLQLKIFLKMTRLTISPAQHQVCMRRIRFCLWQVNKFFAFSKHQTIERI